MSDEVGLVELSPNGKDKISSHGSLAGKHHTLATVEKELDDRHHDTGSMDRHRLLPDTMAAYLYYAEQHRGPSLRGGVEETVAPSRSGSTLDVDKDTELARGDKGWGRLLRSSGISHQEHERANRAVKTATWLAAFYLMTTDVLGPYSTPYAIAQLGYGTGAILYTIMMICAAYSAWILWVLFLRLDSPEFPVNDYGNLAYKIFGNAARIGCSTLQALQLWFNVGVLILANAQGLSQVADGRVCFSVLALIWALLGMAVGQIKTLQRFGPLANCAIWLNLICLGLIMGVVVHTSPNYEGALAQYGTSIVDISSPAPISVPAFSSGAVSTQIVAVMQIVYSYGGATIFVELLSEMRRPFDFWKALILSQVTIYVAYLTFGIFVAHYQGQYTINPSSQSLGPHWAQIAANVINLVASILAAVLYGNVGLKVLYSLVIQKALNGPPLHSKKGRIWWTILVPSYWSMAFILASAIPQFNNISALVAAVCILQFSYTFPPLLMFSFEIQRGAAEGEIYDPVTGTVQRHDSWRDMSRWKRGFGRTWYIKLFNLILFVASLSLAALGMWAAIVSIRTAFSENGTSTSFGCKSPV